MNPKILTKWNIERPAGRGIRITGPKVVETAGYIPAKTQIENLMIAGQRLGEYRKEMYSFDAGVPDDGHLDETRNPNFDMADAYQLYQSLKARLKQQKEKAEETAEQMRREKEDEGQKEKEIKVDG